VFYPPKLILLKRLAFGVQLVEALRRNIEEKVSPSFGVVDMKQQGF